MSPELRRVLQVGLGMLLGVVACTTRHPVQAPEKAPAAVARPAAPPPASVPAPPAPPVDAGPPMDAGPADAAPTGDASSGYVFEPYESDEDRAEDRRSGKRLKAPVNPPWLFQRGAPKGFRAAQVVVWREERPRRTGKFHQQFKKCWKYGGELDARALFVTDEKGRLRAFFEETGSEDSAGTLRYFYDEHERLRLLYVDVANVDNGRYQWAVALDAKGSLLGCRMRTVHTGGGPGNLCDGVEDSELLLPDAQAARAECKSP